jgi:hypothetical protein
MKWLIQGLSLNLEAEKGHPSPLKAASPGGLINLGSSLMPDFNL